METRQLTHIGRIEIFLFDSGKDSIKRLISEKATKSPFFSSEIYHFSRIPLYKVFISGVKPLE